MSIQVKEKAILLSAESKPYDFNGNSGVSHKVRVSIGGEIYNCNSNEKQVLELKDSVSREGEVTIEFRTRKEALSAVVVDFEPED